MNNPDIFGLQPRVHKDTPLIDHQSIAKICDGWTTDLTSRNTNGHYRDLLNFTAKCKKLFTCVFPQIVIFNEAAKLAVVIRQKQAKELTLFLASFFQSSPFTPQALKYFWLQLHLQKCLPEILQDILQQPSNTILLKNILTAVSYIENADILSLFIAAFIHQNDLKVSDQLSHCKLIIARLEQLHARGLFSDEQRKELLSSCAKIDYSSSPQAFILAINIVANLVREITVQQVGDIVPIDETYE